MFTKFNSCRIYLSLIIIFYMLNIWVLLFLNVACLWKLNTTDSFFANLNTTDLLNNLKMSCIHVNPTILLSVGSTHVINKSY